MMSFLLCLSDPIPNLFSKDQALVDVLSMLFWCFFLSLQSSKCLFCSHLILDWGAFQDTNLVLKRSGSWCILHVVLVFLLPLQSFKMFSLCCFLFLTEELFKTPTLFSREQALDVFSVLFWFFFVSLQSSNCCFVGIFFLCEELSKTPTLFSKVQALTWCDLHVVFLSYYLVLFSLFWFLLSVFIFLLASLFIISSLLWFCWATPHHVLSLLSLGLVTENSACWNLKYEMLMHEIHPHPLAGAGLLLLGSHVCCIWILHEKMIQVHIYLWTGSSRGQDRTLSILDKEEEP